MVSYQVQTGVRPVVTAEQCERVYQLSYRDYMDLMIGFKVLR